SAASSTSTVLAITSGPMPSPPTTAILYVVIPSWLPARRSDPTSPKHAADRRNAPLMVRPTMPGTGDAGQSTSRFPGGGPVGFPGGAGERRRAEWRRGRVDGRGIRPGYVAPRPKKLSDNTSDVHVES